MDQHHQHEHLAEEMAGWISDLDICDGYLVLLGDPTAPVSPPAFGPYTGRAAVEVADQLSAAVHGPATHSSPRVVRLHHPRTEPHR